MTNLKWCVYSPPTRPGSTMRYVENPEILAALFQADRETHLYGLADLEEPFWSNSTWYRDGDALVGLVSVGEDWTTVYAMSRVAPEATLGLLSRVQDTVPAGTWVTGPVGLLVSTSELRTCRDIGSHWRMILELL